MITIAQLLAEQSDDQEFCSAVNKVVELTGATHFSQDDSADGVGAVIGALLAEVPYTMQQEIWTSGEYTLYKFTGRTPVYRLWQSDVAGTYNCYFW